MRTLTRSTILLLVVLAACAKAPPDLPAADLLLFKADQAQVAIGTAQHAAIELNKIKVCPTGPTSCHPLLSDANTKIVIDAVANAVKAIQAVPNGWLATSHTVLATITQRLDQAGKTTFGSYVTAAGAIIDALQ